jgi:hypothetical protein
MKKESKSYALSKFSRPGFSPSEVDSPSWRTSNDIMMYPEAGIVDALFELRVKTKDLPRHDTRTFSEQRDLQML